MSLFKYVIPERVDILKNRRIRFTQPSAFNDPFEMQPFFEHLGVTPDGLDTSEEEKQRVKEFAAKEFYARVSDWGREHIGEEFFTELFELAFEAVYPSYVEALLSDSPGVVEALRRHVPERINKRLGVLCLTEKPDNLLMWAHYAQNHQGFVIEFDDTHSFFGRPGGFRAESSEWLHREMKDMCGHLQKVEYADERPAAKPLMSLTAVEVFLLKSREWEYEREWRMFRLLEDCEEVVGAGPGGVHLFSLPPECVKGVITGCRMPWRSRNDLIRAISDDERFAHVKLYGAALDEKRFALNISPES